MFLSKTVLVWSTYEIFVDGRKELLIALVTMSAVKVCATSNNFLLVSLVTNLVSLEEECLPSFEVLNCLLNLAASCLDDENEILLKVIASFSAVHFALWSIPLIIIHSMVRFVFWSMFSIKSLHFYAHRCVSGCLYSVLAVQMMWVSFEEVVSSSYHVQYLCWYSFLMESVASSRDVV